MVIAAVVEVLVPVPARIMFPIGTFGFRTVLEEDAGMVGLMVVVGCVPSAEGRIRRIVGDATALCITTSLRPTSL